MKSAPMFNIRGKGAQGTLLGSCVSLSILVLIFFYAMVKLNVLFSKVNPNITEVKEDWAIQDEELNPVDNGLRFAWHAESFHSKYTIDDPRYVKMLVRLYGKKDGKIFEKIIDHHKCTEDDMAKFAPPTREA